MSGNLTVAQVAQIRETDRISAYRWLLRNARRHLRRRGRLLVISRRAFALLHDAPMDPRVEKRLRTLEEASEEAQNRLDAHARALSFLNAL